MNFQAKLCFTKHVIQDLGFTDSGIGLSANGVESNSFKHSKSRGIYPGTSLHRWGVRGISSKSEVANTLD